jgi:hypothetical protein
MSQNGSETWVWNTTRQHFAIMPVSAEVLCDLTSEDLEGLGVSAIGHRRRLLVAIAKLRGETASRQAARSTDDHRASTKAAERRQITVLHRGADQSSAGGAGARHGGRDTRGLILCGFSARWFHLSVFPPGSIRGTGRVYGSLGPAPPARGKAM